MEAQCNDESTASVWSPGRTTAVPPVSSKRARKREQDRLFQRKKRMKTKARIAELETVFETVNQGHGYEKEGTLLQELTKARRHRDSLAKALESIIRIAQSQQFEPGVTHEQERDESWLKEDLGSHFADLDVSSVDINGSELSLNMMFCGSAHANDSQNGQALGLSQTQTSISDAPSAAFVGGYMLGDLEGNMVSTQLNPDLIPQPSAVPIRGCACSTNLGDSFCHVNIWRFINDTLYSARQSISNDNAPFLGSTEDVAIQVVLHGWDKSQHGGLSNVLWQSLRRVDQILFIAYGDVERLAALRLCILLLEYHLDPLPSRLAKLPVWYRERPSQLLNHSYAIDFLGWPGVRERFIFFEHTYCSNRFWYLFAKSFHFDWPFELRDCFTKNVETGQYRFSASFEQRMSELRNWKMGPTILKEFPEFEIDLSV